MILLLVFSSLEEYKNAFSPNPLQLNLELFLLINYTKSKDGKYQGEEI